MTTVSEESQLAQTIEMFEVITQSQPQDYQSLEILKEAYSKLGREKEAMATSKRIAEAYVELGQLSSAILEYETILQRSPDDEDVQKALLEIEKKANNFAAPEALTDISISAPAPASAAKPAVNGHARPVAPGLSKPPAPGEIDDGRAAMRKAFVDSKLISTGDFDLCWSTPDLSKPPMGVSDPFVHVLANKGIVTADRSLKLLVEKSRLAYLPLEKYETDLELARSFPADVCRRWCVLPFDKMSKTVFVATVNPFNRQAAKELSEATKLRLLWYLASPAELMNNIRKIYRY